MNKPLLETDLSVGKMRKAEASKSNASQSAPWSCHVLAPQQRSEVMASELESACPDLVVAMACDSLFAAGFRSRGKSLGPVGPGAASGRMPLPSPYVERWSKSGGRGENCLKPFFCVPLPQQGSCAHGELSLCATPVPSQRFGRFASWPSPAQSRIFACLVRPSDVFGPRSSE